MNILFTFYPHGDWFYYIKKDSQCQYALFFLLYKDIFIRHYLSNSPSIT